MKNVNFLMKIATCFFATTSGLSSLKSQTYQWNNVAIGGGGFVSGLITSKNERGLMYARTDVGGAYKWDTTSSSWKPLLDWASSSQTGYMGVLSLAIDPSATNRLYMLVGTSYLNSGKTAILTSTNYGSTFTIVDVTSQFKANGNALGRQNGERLQVDPNNSNVLYCGTQGNGLWRSFNQGNTWSKVASFTDTTSPNGNGISFVLFDPQSKHGTSTSQTIYVGVSQTGSSNVYVSKNGGSTFAAVTGAPPTFIPQRAVITTDSTVYITYGNGDGPSGNSDTSLHEPMDNGAVWKYKSATNTWTNVTPSGFTKPFSGISIDPNHNNNLLLSTINTYLAQYVNSGTTVYGDRIFRSTNGGTSWTDLVHGSIILNPNGATWTNGTNIHWVGCAEFNPFDTSKAWVTSGQGVFSCDNLSAATTTWKFNVNGLEETVPRDIVSVETGPLVSVIYDYDGFMHTDISQYAPRLTPTIGTETGVAVAGQNGNILLRTGGNSSNGGIQYYSLNQGSTWTQCAVSKGYAGKVAISANGYAYLHCPEGSSATYRTTNQGTSWTTCTGINIANAIPVADQTNAQNFYAYDRTNGNFWVSTDRGNSFTTVSTNLGQWGSQLIRSVPDSNGHVWVPLAGNGLKYTQDAGATFTAVGGGLTSCSAVGFGKAATGATYPTIYIWGIVSGVEGVYRSINKGSSWTRVNDDAHEYGGIGNGQFVIGSMNTYGIVYMSTVGRGIAYGKPIGTSGTNAIKPPSEPVANAIQPQAFNMRLFPNPVINNELTVYIESDKMQNVSLKIVGVDGKELMLRTVFLQIGGNKVSLDGALPNQSGLYFLSAFGADGKQPMSTIKFLK